MDADRVIQSKDILAVINKLYDENTRGDALKELSQMKCQEDLRTACLYNSFGIVTILQGEILSVYKYLNDTNVDEKVEIRACNALAIIHSLVTNPEVVPYVIESNMLYFIVPLIESRNKRFVNIRKVCLAVIYEISMHKRNPNLIIQLFLQGLVQSCLSVFERVEMNEKNTITLIVFNVLTSDNMLNYILQRQKLTQIIGSFLVKCGIECTMSGDKKTLNDYRQKVLDYLSLSGSRDLVNSINEEVRRQTELR